MAHATQMIEVLKDYEFEQVQGTTLIAREPIGVCGFITPWNWPINQIMCKVAPALAAGLHDGAEAERDRAAQRHHPRRGPPRGGRAEGRLQPGERRRTDGGPAIAAHPGVDMVSFTGSTRAGILVAKAAADTVKRVHQELGGKSAESSCSTMPT